MAAGGGLGLPAWTPGWDSWLDLATTRSPTPSWGSTLGAARFHGRVRNGVGWGPCAVITRSSQESKDQRSDARDQMTPETAATSAHPSWSCSREAWGMGGRDRRSDIGDHKAANGSAGAAFADL